MIVSKQFAMRMKAVIAVILFSLAAFAVVAPKGHAQSPETCSCTSSTCTSSSGLGLG